MLQRTAPYPLQPFVAAMASRARCLGLRTSTSGAKPNLSDWIREVTPVEWMAVHWPELQGKRKGDFFFSLDSVLNCRTVPSTGFAYLTALAALWDTSEEMYQALLDLGHHPIDISSDKWSNPRGSTYWQGEVWEAYLKHQGRVRAMAPELGVNATYLREKLNQLGLPSLHDVVTSLVWRAYLRFEAGESLLSACDAEGIDVGAVEPLIRLSCARVPVLVAHHFGDELRACDEESGIFETPAERTFAQDILQQIGRELSPNYPLGHGDMGALVVFYNTTPNNTLPIFWCGGTVQERPWKPLFPRA